MLHITLHHDTFGFAAPTGNYDGTVEQAKRKLGASQRAAGYGWTAIIRDESGDTLACRYPGESKWLKP